MRAGQDSPGSMYCRSRASPRSASTLCGPRAEWFARSPSHVVDELDDPVGVRLLLDEVELGKGRARIIGEESLARPEHQREHQKVVAVDESGRGQALRQRGTAVHDDGTA